MAETGPESHPDKAIPISAQLAKKCRARGRQMHHDPDVDELSGRHIVDIAKNCVGVRLLDVMRARVALSLFRKAVADLRDAGTSVARGGDYARL